jgi:tyrosinase
MARASVSRRRFLSRTAIAAGAVIAGPTLFDIEELLAQPTFVRPDVFLPAAVPHLNAYKTAITAMRALPISNPVSWSYQAAIHGTTATPVRTAWNTCQHGNFFFLSWHRMYLYWFERIVRSKSGMASWALPYWNYIPGTSVAATDSRKLPLPFRSPANAATNPLFTTNRGGMNSGTAFNTTIADASVALAQTAFTGPSVNFGGNNPGSGQLELKPHNQVHVAVAGWMGNPLFAAQDPIFWLHHANIDRYWNVWLKQGGGRVDPVSNAAWRNTKFTFFRENGTAVQMTACDILNASLQLQYTYQNEALPQVTQTCPTIIIPPILFAKRRLPIPIPDPQMVIDEARPVTRIMEMKQISAAVMSDAKAAIASPAQNLVLDFGDVSADTQPGVIFEVWVGIEGLPDEKTPQAHHIGDIALFAQGVRSNATHNDQPHNATFSFPLDAAVGAALARGADKVKITVIPRDPLESSGKSALKKPASPLRITNMTVNIEEAKK